MDILTKEQRSDHMKKIGSRDTMPELTVRRMLHRMGLRYRLHADHLPGTPDILLPKYKTVIFVHGCFWHRHPRCSRAFKPSTNQIFWDTKLARNVERDKEVQRKLKLLNWKILVIWECQTKPSKLHDLENRLNRWFFPGKEQLTSPTK